MEYLQQMLAVLAVFGILGGSLWWLRRRGLGNIAMTASKKPNRVLSQIERLPISSTHSVHLVRMADRAILIASWPGGCQAIESSSWREVAKGEAQ